MPTLIYGYGGFPPESYTIQYPCPGSPTLAHDITTKLKSAGITTTEDPNRGFDHGLFVPLKIMYPEADIPCVQLSLLSSLNPESHIRLGEALRDFDTSYRLRFFISQYESILHHRNNRDESRKQRIPTMAHCYMYKPRTVRKRTK